MARERRRRRHPPAGTGGPVAATPARPPEPDPGTGATPAAGGGVLSAACVADVATALWRADAKLAGVTGPGGSADARLGQARRHLEAALDRLAEAGVEVQAHDGDRYHAGQALEVVAFEPGGEGPERVVETVRPSVYLAGRPIQQGAVVVGGTAGGDDDEGDPGGPRHR